MLTLHPKFLIDTHQRKYAAVIPITEWQKIIEQLEEFEDIKAYDAAKAANSKTVPFTAHL